MPLLTPGSSTTAGTSNHRLAIWRRLAWTSGTDEVTAIPVTASSMSSPFKSRSWVSRRACSSAVRTSTVDSRQWWARPTGSVPSLGTDSSTGADGSSAKRPTTVSVFPTSMASSMAFLPGSDGSGASVDPGPSGPEVEPEIEDRRRVGQGAGGQHIGTGGGEGRGGRQGHAARHLDEGVRAGGPDPGDGPGHQVGPHVVQHHHRGAGGDRLVHLVQPVALDLDHPARPPGPGEGGGPGRWRAQPPGEPVRCRAREGQPSRRARWTASVM